VAKVEIKLDHHGMASLLKSGGVQSELRSRAERVAEAARASAPVETGEYRDAIAVADDTTDRAVVRVGSTAPHAFIVEAATGNMARALDAAG
jgi:hypothetical protein